MTTITTQRKKMSYFREVQAELKKVSWTSRKELFASTKAVIIATFIFGFGIYFCDVLIRGAISGLGNFARVIFG